MTPNGNGTVKKVVVGVAVTVIASLTLYGLYTSGRIASLEEQLKNQKGWIDETRKDIDTVRRENNSAHTKIMDEIKDQGKTNDSKFTEILRGMKK